jgi:hypothetical protein
MPPMTITTKARISTGSPMPTCTDWMRADQRPGKTRQGRAKREDDGVEKADIDTECRDHFAVRLAGADLHAEPGAADQQAKPGRDHDARQ